ncbi:MAG: glycolate oxidase subunit GlcE [Bordetella sp. SCN 67-23]|nr:glycolate oxidase subunit GlcE [Burkholderiales bacterium]ODS74314.1 MAG: glycolate oxidase subunit GlcE [Bordetella sp. SCN 67-23]OJW89652.1 MAG: glycolate oxidase subunit GlcE [Burkholderiales bacterium 67-32]
MDVLLSDLRARVLMAHVGRKSLYIRGGGTKGFYGLPVDHDAVLDLLPYAGVIDYQPSELVLSARAGTPLAQVEEMLAEQGQMLAFEPPHFSDGATLGGCIATALAGPRRASAGSVGDFVLGVRLLDAQGRVLRFGGEVMKNVAGYDVSRLVAGSLGTLGAILEVSLKVLPRPACEITLRFEMDEATALRRMNAWGGQALPISATAWSGGDGTGCLTVRLSGAEAAIAAARAVLGGEALADEEAWAWWRSLRDHAHPFLAVRSLWRLSVPAVTRPLGLGPTLIEWGGAQRWLCGPQSAQRVRQAAALAGGHATLFRAVSVDEARASGVFHPLSTPVAAIHRRLKNEFDPEGVFNPGRMYPDL